MSKIYLRVSLLFLTFLLTSCEEKLTRENAKEKITSQLNLPLDEIKSFKVDDYTYFADKTAKQYNELKGLGLLKNYTFKGEFPSQYHAKADFTDEGNKYVVSEVRNQGYFDEVDVKVAKIEFGEITGIKEIKIGDLISYSVEYTLKRNEINPFGKIVYNLEERIVKRTILFSKYDDGWRPGDLDGLKEVLIYNFDKSEDFGF